MNKLQAKSLTLIICLFLPLLSHAKEWTYHIEPYMLAASIEGDASIGRVSGAPIAVGFDTILENLDMAGMLHFEAINENGWGAILDYGFMDLGADISNSRGGIVDASVRQGTFEGLLMYRSEIGNGTLDATVGIRWWDNDLEINVDPIALPGSSSAEVKADWVDLIVGARWINQISNKWKFQTKGDIGGFGLESDLTYSLAAGFLYQMSDKWTLDLQYKGLWVDFEEGSAGSTGRFSYDTVTHGPLIGFSYKF